MRRTALRVSALAVLALAAGGCASAATSPGAAASTALERAVGCYAIDTPTWPDGIARRVRLTLEPVADLTERPQYQVRAAPGEPDDAERYPTRVWSLYADDRVVSVVLSSDRDQLALTFDALPGRGARPGSLTFFRHDRMEMTEPVEVTVRPESC